MEISGTGNIECDQKMYGTDQIRLDINFKVRAITIKAGEISWDKHWDESKLANFIKELTWAGIDESNQKCIE